MFNRRIICSFGAFFTYAGDAITDGQRHQLYALNAALEERHQHIQAGDYNPSDEARESLDAAGNMIKKILGDYLHMKRPTW